MPLLEIAPHDLTSNTSHAPFVTSASTQSSQAYRAFNIDLTSSSPWGDNSATSGTGWLQIDLGASKTVSGYGLRGGSTGFNATAWQLLGSPDGATWTTLDSRTGQTLIANTLTSFTPTVVSPFRYIRLNILASQGPRVSVNELYLQATVTLQTITFAAIGAHLTTDAPITLAATASSGLAVTYSVSGPATLSGSVLTITGAGTVTVTASQAGNSTYAAAPPIARSFAVTPPPAAQTITFPAIADKVTTDTPFDLTATASSGLEVTYTCTGPAIITIYSTSVKITLTGGTGTVVVTAHQAGNASYLAAPNVSRSFTVSAPPAIQTIDFPVIPGKLSTDPAFVLGASASSGLPISYAVSGPATISGGILTLTGGTGYVTVTASQPGDATHAAAVSVARTFLVSAPAAQTITFPTIADQLNTVGTVALTATASSGLPVTYSVTSGPAAIFGASAILTGGLGPVTITAYQPGDATHAAAVPVSRTFNVLAPALVPQTITFPALPDRLTGAVFSLDATASSGLPVTYTISGPATLSGSIVTVTGTGAVTVTAWQAGDATWAAAVPVSRTFGSIAVVAKRQRGNIAYDQIRATHRQGSGAAVQMFTGAPPAPGHLAAFDPNGNLVDSGSTSAGGSSSGSQSVFGETPAGVIGSANTVFTLAFTPAAGALNLELNGVVQRRGIDYALSGAQITYTVAPRTGDAHTASYRR
jgi:hypothetical protein